MPTACDHTAMHRQFLCKKLTHIHWHMIDVDFFLSKTKILSVSPQNQNKGRTCLSGVNRRKEWSMTVASDVRKCRYFIFIKFSGLVFLNVKRDFLAIRSSSQIEVLSVAGLFTEGDVSLPIRILNDV